MVPDGHHSFLSQLYKINAKLIQSIDYQFWNTSLLQFHGMWLQTYCSLQKFSQFFQVNKSRHAPWPSNCTAICHSLPFSHEPATSEDGKEIWVCRHGPKEALEYSGPNKWLAMVLDEPLETYLIDLNSTHLGQSDLQLFGHVQHSWQIWKTLKAGSQGGFRKNLRAKSGREKT